ncbi:hypothetical protein BDZ85DRAFT_72489 [Elsinoe ampelina]|uniref:EthD domain-containing protein n=1 Tax=Elsinoe ampelina TaxID=302913 RepID=A0A6A6GJV2_9PEZI|nr:hypothetical protein BDZ85DRAFT_72489 [Elsinoe ampelina]
MPAEISVLYPQGAKFNLDYYLKTHMPLVYETWSPLGLKSWKVAEFPDDQPFKIQATLVWEELSAFQSAAGGPTAKTVLDDIPNFSDKQPTFLTGTVVGTS